MVRSELFARCTALLGNAAIPDADFDTLCIFQDVLHEKNPLFAPSKAVAAADESAILSLIRQRIDGMPLQYLLREWDFWSYTFRVGEGVLIPRPDTETLVEDVLKICKKNALSAPKILDLCSGSGCIAVTLSREIQHSVVYAVEKSGAAFAYLTENIALNHADVTAVQADVLDPVTAGNFHDIDIIVSNPPYLTAAEMDDLQPEVRREPEMALYGGADGLDFYARMTPLWKNSLRPGGWLCYEFGMGQHDKVGEILTANGFTDISFSRDAGGIVRTISGRNS